MISVAYCTASACSPFEAVICDRMCRPRTSRDRSLVRRASIQGASSPGRNRRRAMMTSRHRMAPRALRIARRAQMPSASSIGVRRVLEVDPDIGGQPQLDRAGPHFDARPLTPAFFKCRAQFAEDRVERGLDLAWRRIGPDDAIQLVFGDRPVPLAGKKRKREPPLASGELALLDERLAVLDRDSTGKVDPHGRQGFANLPAMVPPIGWAYITDYGKELSCRKSSIARAATS